MRILFKILLFPVTLALSGFIAACRSVCHFTGALLAVGSGIVFTITLLALIPPVTKMSTPSTVMLSVFAYLISPYGIPLPADWLPDKLDERRYSG